MNTACAPEKSRGVRVEVDGLVFVACPAESVFLLNVSEGGMGIQAMDVLEPGRTLDFSIELSQPTSLLTGQARVVWSDRSGRAGLQFVDLSNRTQLVTWMTGEHTSN